MNSGQICIAPDYAPVAKTVTEQFCAEFAEQCHRMVGDVLHNPRYPRIISRRHFEHLQELMARVTVKSGGRSDSATLDRTYRPCGCETGFPGHTKGNLRSPALSAALRTLDEAEEFVESREKPLALYLFTKSKETEKRVLGRLAFGGACVNNTVSHISCDGLAFGGVGERVRATASTALRPSAAGRAFIKNPACSSCPCGTSPMGTR